MPSARELLDQADALMRRNRGRTHEPEVPELYDAVGSETLAESGLVVRGSPQSSARSGKPLDDIPELTEAVEEIEAPSIQELPSEDDDELSRWLEENVADVDTLAVMVEPDEPPALAEKPRVRAVEAPIVPIARWVQDERVTEIVPELRRETPAFAASAPVASAPVASASVTSAPVASAPVDATPVAAAPVDATPVAATPFAATPITSAAVTFAPVTSAPVAATPIASAPVTSAPDAPASIDGDDAQHWTELAEEIRMQVLQRIDIFTDTGLHQQLTARLQPIVDRASADLVATINREVGQLVRAYVAEAIEREIEHWRRGGG